MAEAQKDQPYPFPYVGQIIRVGFTFPPEGWMRCEGQSVPVEQYEILYKAIGNTYGGDGNNFSLPDLRGRVPIGMSQAYPAGQSGGSANVTLTPDQMPSHQHSVSVLTKSGTVSSPHSENALSSEGPAPVSLVYTYAPYDAAHMVALRNLSISSTEGHAHENRQPYQVVLYAICAIGVFVPPSA